MHHLAIRGHTNKRLSRLVLITYMPEIRSQPVLMNSEALDGLVVIKEQLCRDGRRFNELRIFKIIHG
jgi:hypothetical protein